MLPDVFHESQVERLAPYFIALRETLRKVADGESLTEGEAERALETIMEGNAPSAATAALLTALRVKGESVPEIVGFGRAMRRFGAKVEAPEGVVDACGTGGGAKGTINVSTAAAFVARVWAPSAVNSASIPEMALPTSSTKRTSKVRVADSRRGAGSGWRFAGREERSPSRAGRTRGPGRPTRRHRRGR